MMMKRASFATSMSCFLVAAAIVGCMHVETTGVDHGPPPDASDPGTSLAGTIQCGSMSCQAGTLCIHWSAGIDAGVPGNSESCEVVPLGCRVQDCRGSACPACIAQLCSSAGYTDYFYLEGRDLHCPGV